MQLGRCKDALTVFGKLSNLDPSDEDYADTVFRMGQCLVELEQWEDAFVHFHTLYDAAVEFEEHNKNVALAPGTRVLDKNKIARWLEKVRPHVPELAQLKADEATDRVLLVPEGVIGDEVRRHPPDGFFALDVDESAFDQPERDGVGAGVVHE